MTIQATSAALGAGTAGQTQLLQNLASSPKPPAAASRGGHDTPELKKAFNDFVGQTFFGELLKQMRATLDKPAFFHGGMGEDIFQSQLDQVIVEQMTDASAKSFSDPMYQLLMAPRS
jgi:peptidoglycan hydrolase FlgJ